MVIFKWVTPEEGKKLDNAIDVSSYSSSPYRVFSPFVYDEAFAIPVPGSEKERSQSVEGIWQGLKVVDGKHDPSLFRGKSKKIKLKPEGHLYGNQLISYVEARKKIYIPSYTYHVVNNAIPAVKDDLLERMDRLTSRYITIYDVDSNNDIHDVSQPLSHASVLVKLLNVLKDSPLPPFNESRFSDLEDQIETALSYRSSLDEEEKYLLDEVITFAYLFAQDNLKQTFSLRAIRSGNKAGNFYRDNRIKSRIKNYTPNEVTKQPYLTLCL